LRAIFLENKYVRDFKYNRTAFPMKDRKLKEYIPLALKGMAMGAADVVPGVSGGTMAFILGIYEELIHSIHTIASVDTLKLLASFKFKEAYSTLPWRFLAAVGSGILCAIVILASAIKWALRTHPEMLWAFFFGLVVASIFTVVGKVKQWSVSRYAILVGGIIVAYLIVDMSPTETPTAPWFIFLSGVIAICAMILPGISGSFLLVLMGKYEYILGSVTGLKTALIERNIGEITNNALIVLYTGLGAIVGLATFVKVLDWLFKKYHDLTVALLIGFMGGSLWKIWPWKNTISTYTDRHGVIKPLVQENIIPECSRQVLMAVGIAVAGFIFIMIMTKMAETSELDDSENQTA